MFRCPIFLSFRKKCCRHPLRAPRTVQLVCEPATGFPATADRKTLIDSHDRLSYKLWTICRWECMRAHESLRPNCETLMALSSPIGRGFRFTKSWHSPEMSSPRHCLLNNQQERTVSRLFQPKSSKSSPYRVNLLCCGGSVWNAVGHMQEAERHSVSKLLQVCINDTRKHNSIFCELWPCKFLLPELPKFSFLPISKICFYLFMQDIAIGTGRSPLLSPVEGATGWPPLPK